jgi:hypothetical protein
MIVYFASDLVWATRIKGVADDLGIPARPVRNIEMLEARLADSPVAGLIVDLDAPETALALVQHLREWEARKTAENQGTIREPLRIVAFGPHVETQALAQAKLAGADAAMTRGAFHHQLAQVLTAVAAGAK